MSLSYLLHNTTREIDTTGMGEEVQKNKATSKQPRFLHSCPTDGILHASIFALQIKDTISYTHETVKHEGTLHEWPAPRNPI